MPPETKAQPQSPNALGIVALAAIGVALVAAAALGTYDASLARAHAVRDTAPENAAGPGQYLPGSSIQVGTLPEPLMAERRAALRAAFDRDDAPIDAFDRLRAVPGHEDEARSLLSQFWERRAMLARDPVHRVLYALQARVVDDDEGRRHTADSAIAAVGPLLRVRHVGEGTIVSADAKTLVLRASDWLHVLNLDSGTSFDLPATDTDAALVDGRRMVTWGGGTGRIWDLDAPGGPSDPAGPSAPAASFELVAGEVPLSFAGATLSGCVLMSSGRLWHEGGGIESVTHAHRRWLGGVVNETCDRVVLRDDGAVAYRRRGSAWTLEPSRVAGKKSAPDRSGKTGEARVETCAARAPRCVMRDGTGVRSIWDLGASPPRRLEEGIACEPERFSPDGTRLLCRASPYGSTFYSDDRGTWTRSDVTLPGVPGAPAVSRVFVQDDGTIGGSARNADPGAVDRSDLLFFAAQGCASPPVVERAFASIRILPTGDGAIFTYPARDQTPSGATEFFGFGSRGESLASASNAWLGQRTGERLLERDASDSAGEKSYELDGEPFAPAAALGDVGPVSSVHVDNAFFVDAPEPSLLVTIGYVKDAGSDAGVPLRAVARWDLEPRRSCGPAISGAIDGVSPTGDAVVIDGRIERLGDCAAGRAFEASDVTGVSAVAPNATHWIARHGESLQLEGPERAPAIVPGVERASDARVAFSPSGSQFVVTTAASLCRWIIRDDGAPDLDGCRWSTGGWASDAVWASAEGGEEKAVVFDRTAGGAVPREFFGSHEAEPAHQGGGDRACDARPGPDDPPLAVLQQWEDRLGHHFRDQATPTQDTREMTSSEIVPAESVR